MSTLEAFARRMEVRADLLDEFSADLVRGVAEVIARAYVINTPVDTSKARSNTVVAVNRSPTEVLKPHYPGKRGSTSVQSTNEVLRRARIVISKHKPGQFIAIVNNTEYIIELERGKSPQGSDMAGKALNAARAYLKEKIKQ